MGGTSPGLRTVRPRPGRGAGERGTVGEFSGPVTGGTPLGGEGGRAYGDIGRSRRTGSPKTPSGLNARFLDTNGEGMGSVPVQRPLLALSMPVAI